MRSTTGFILVAALMAGGCDRGSPPAEQANANVAANGVAEDASAPSPDEATGEAAAAPVGKIDRTHKGTAAPDYPFIDPTGKPVTLAAYRGKPVLLNLWATWCAPCVAEMPTLDALAAREGARLTVIALSQDLDATKVPAFWTNGGYRVLKPSTDAKLAFSTGLGANLPTTILYDSAGKEVWRMTGSLDWAGPEAKAALAEGA